MNKSLLSLVVLSAGLALAQADTIAQWNFNSNPPDGSTTTGTKSPSVGSGTASFAGGTAAAGTGEFATGDTVNDPAGSTDNSGWNTSTYPAQGAANKTAGVRFDVSTAGMENLVITWSHRVSGTASKYARLQYTLNGTDFVDFPSAVAMSAANAFESKTADLTPVAGANGNPNFGFQIVTEFESTATGSGSAGYVTASASSYSVNGTVRLDMVTVSGMPIAGGNTPPAISSLTNLTLRVNQSTGALPVTVGDVEDGAGSLTLDRASSDPTVIPTDHILFGGSGSNRTVTVTAADQTGASTLTLYVIDTGGKSNSTSFLVTVRAANTAPTLSKPGVTNTLVGTPRTVPFTVSDVESPAASLTVTASSANTALVPDANLTLAGSDTDRTLTITPATGQTGVAVITLTVSDGTNTASAVFPVMVVPSASVIFNDPFTYADGSIITNSGFLWSTRSGTVGQMQVISGQLQVTSTQTEDVLGPLIGGPYLPNNGTVLYCSFKVSFSALPSLAGSLFAHFADGNTLRGRIYGTVSNAAPDALRLAVANGSASFTELPADLSLNTTYTVVTRYAVDTAATTLWLNPVSEADSSVTATDTQSPARIVSYGFRQDTGVGTMLVDDLKVGLTFADVLGGGAPVRPRITRIAIAGGNVEIDFTAGASDQASDFTLVRAGTVTGGYANAGATITALGGGAFRATVAPSGAQQFYQIKR